MADADKAVLVADEDVKRVRQARLDCDERREIAEQRQRAVLESPAYRDATSLIEVEERAADAARGVAQAEERLAAATSEAEAAGGELATALA